MKLFRAVKVVASGKLLIKEALRIFYEPGPLDLKLGIPKANLLNLLKQKLI